MNGFREGYDVAYIEDTEHGITYTACMRPQSGGWFGWIAEEKHVTHVADTKEDLVADIESILFATLEAEGEAFDKVLEEDAKSGKLARFLEELSDDKDVSC